MKPGYADGSPEFCFVPKECRGRRKRETWSGDEHARATADERQQ